MRLSTSQLDKGPPQLKKSLKFQLLAEIFWTPPSSKKGPTDENVGISYLIVIIKFGFFRVSNPSPPLFHQKAEPNRFYQLRWPLRSKSKYIIIFLIKWSKLILDKCELGFVHLICWRPLTDIK